LRPLQATVRAQSGRVRTAETAERGRQTERPTRRPLRDGGSRCGRGHNSVLTVGAYERESPLASSFTCVEVSRNLMANFRRCVVCSRLSCPSAFARNNRASTTSNTSTGASSYGIPYSLLVGKPPTFKPPSSIWSVKVDYEVFHSAIRRVSVRSFRCQRTRRAAAKL